jgi:hypothetical protein
LELLRIINEIPVIFDVRTTKTEKLLYTSPFLFVWYKINQSRRGNHQMKKAVPLFGLIVLLMFTSDYLPTKRAQYKVFHNDGVATVTIDQNEGGFTSLGVFVFNSQ